MLADAGYACGLAGRLHTHPGAPDHLASTRDGLAERRGDDGYTDFHWGGAPQQKGTEYERWLRGKGISPDLRPSDVSPYVHQGLPSPYDQTTWCTDKAIAFIERWAEKGRPWLYSLNPFAPHHPFAPPPEYLEAYRQRISEIPLPRYREGELDEKPPVQKNDHRGAYNRSGFYPFPEMRVEDHRWVRAAYWAMIDHIDTQVGRVVDALEKTGQLDHTLIIYTSDHGEMLGDHGIYLKGPYFYEATVRVPLIFSGPGVVGKKRSNALVQLMDLAPTILDAAGVAHPAGMQAKSLWPMLTGEAPQNSHWQAVYSEYYNAMPFHEDAKCYATMVANHKAKLVLMHGRDEGELYDLRSDPGESWNRFRDPKYKDLKIEMMQQMCDRMARTADPLPEREARH